MNMKALVIIGVGFLVIADQGLAQGSLTPPGAPAPTMKTLDQLEPRMPISSLPTNITQGGSYYLTANLASTDNGIIISTNNVTLDMMGFTISGDRGISDYGVEIKGTTNQPLENITVRNGGIRNFGSGVWAKGMNNSRIEHLIISGNSGTGLFMNGADDFLCNGNMVNDCTINNNDGYGISFYGYTGQCNDNTMTACTISDNQSWGVYFLGPQCDGNAVRKCIVSRNHDAGVFMVSATANRIEDNQFIGQTGVEPYGIFVGLDCSKNLIVRNMASGQLFDYGIYGANTYGPIVSTNGALPTSGAAAHPWANFSL